VKKRITKKRLNALAEKLKSKAIKAETIKQLLICHRAFVKTEFLLCKYHAPKFDLSTYKPRCFSVILRLNNKYKQQRELRRYVIQAHPTFQCPVSKQI
jgi:hypothetical protein